MATNLVLYSCSKVLQLPYVHQLWMVHYKYMFDRELSYDTGQLVDGDEAKTNWGIVDAKDDSEATAIALMHLKNTGLSEYEVLTCVKFDIHNAAPLALNPFCSPGE